MKEENKKPPKRDFLRLGGPHHFILVAVKYPPASISDAPINSLGMMTFSASPKKGSDIAEDINGYVAAIIVTTETNDVGIANASA